MNLQDMIRAVQKALGYFQRELVTFCDSSMAMRPGALLKSCSQMGFERHFFFSVFFSAFFSDSSEAVRTLASFWVKFFSSFFPDTSEAAVRRSASLWVEKGGSAVIFR